MTTALCQIVFDANDLRRLATFWRDVLDWQITIDRSDEIEIGSGDPGDVPIGFVPTDHPKNRLHLDVASATPDDLQALVMRALNLGARHIDMVQGKDVPWTVLADPEGNEFCVVPPSPVEVDTGRVAAIAFDAIDPAKMGRFWAAATGWSIVDEGDWGVALWASSGTAPFLTFGGGERAAPKTHKNRVHLDVAPPVGGDIDTEAERLIADGATRADIGQGAVPWTMLADPEDNEFCILTPR